MSLPHWLRALRPNPSRERFAEIAREALERVGVPGTFRFDPDDFALVGSERAARWLLGNAYEAYRAAGWWRRSAVLQRYVVAMREAFAAPQTLDEARPRLVPIVRSTASYAMQRLYAENTGESDPAIATQPVVDGLVAAVAIDGETSLAQLGRDGIASWGTSFAEVFAIACRNLRERSQEPFVAMPHGCWVGPWQDDNASGRMLLPELFGRLPLSGDPVAMIPQRGGLLVAGSRDEEGLLEMVSFVRKILDEPHTLSGRAHVLREGVWQRFAPQPGTDLAYKLAECEVLAHAKLCAEQGPLLESSHAQRGDPIHVAAVMGARMTDGSFGSLAVWQEGLPALLPKTDHLVLQRGKVPNDEMALLTWEDAVEVAGTHMRPLDCDPVRCRVDSFPTADEWPAVRARSKG